MYRSTKGASKARRDQINAEIRNLKELLPISEGDKVRLSYLHIMSLACIYTRKSVFFSKGQHTEELEGLLSNQDLMDFVHSLPGFLLTFTSEGKLIYVSENVADHLGHSMVDLVAQGDSIYDIIDPSDHFVMRNQLAMPSSPDSERMFRCRFNTSKTARRQSAGNKMILIRGRFQQPPTGTYWSSNPVFTAFCIPLDPKPNVIQSHLLVDFFESQHAKDLSLLGVSDSSLQYLCYEKSDLINQSWYNLIHPEDLAHLSKQHLKLLNESCEGRAEMVIRLQRKDQLWVWMYSILILEASEASITSYNYIISQEEAWCLRQQLTSEETPVPISAGASFYQDTLLSPGDLSSPDQVFTPLANTPTSVGQSFDFSEPMAIDSEDPILCQTTIPLVENVVPPEGQSENQSLFTLFRPTSHEQTFRRDQLGSVTPKDFTCTPPYTPHQNCSFLFGTLENPPQTTSEQETTILNPEMYYSYCSSLYEKLPPTPDSPGDGGDCTVMRVPEIPGPLYVDLPMLPEGLVTPETSPINQAMFKYSEQEKSEIDLLVKQIGSLSNVFSGVSTKELSSPDTMLLSGHGLAYRSVSLPACLPEIDTTSSFPRSWKSIDLSIFLTCQDPSLPSSGHPVCSLYKDLPDSPPFAETGSPCSALEEDEVGGDLSASPSMTSNVTTDLSPEECSFLEELMSYKTDLEAGASEIQCDRFNDELYQLQIQLQDGFQQDGSGKPSF
ncbi:neuronal PAS domain-containing protein 4A-like isoform X2 [Xenopus laevis]|uniref:Neuronal PAS domain-containing protein 4A-like isoform X2 n=1 Tax=Xenopus laevis TaxID=8355 RepID=A0A8J1KGV1_XENLA|nr:neuronal PAS domain-containing protein 4A-like isoform X2 [Xenopus laevis]